jgi:2-keto-4-pentenoate hydratase/2-oxohepta-3-ene-1,7-dioic acid hydratase in catechol pathway
MKFGTFIINDIYCVGMIKDSKIIDLGPDYHGQRGMINLLTDISKQSDIVRPEQLSEEIQYDLTDVQLTAPIVKPEKFFGVALNYADHIKETGLEQPEYPTLFNKQNSCVVGTGAPIHRPKVSEKLDYEGELGLVIGKRCRHVNREQAKSVIAGYTIVNDVSVRDWQMRSHTWTLGKSFDTHGPVGPWIVTPDEIGDPHNLNIKTWVNEELRQNFSTKHLVFDCYYLVEYLSQVMTLEPGDIIATGTSSGVGVKMKPRGYMKAGDEVRIEIENIGTLKNPVIDEPDSTHLIQ